VEIGAAGTTLKNTGESLKTRGEECSPERQRLGGLKKADLVADTRVAKIWGKRGETGSFVQLERS